MRHPVYDAAIFPRCRSVRVEVLCYLVDARDYYSELKEFNFLADLDLDAPLDQSLADNAHPVSNISMYCYLIMANHRRL